MRLLSIVFLMAFLSFSSNAFSCDCDKSKAHTCSSGCKGHKEGKSCEGSGSCEKSKTTTPAPTEKK